MKQVDVLHVISGDLWAGADVQVYHTLSELYRRSILIPHAILFNDGILSKKLSDTGIDRTIIDENKYNSIEMVLQLMTIIHKLKPRIIHVHAYKEHILVNLAKLITGRRVPIVRTFHGISEPPGYLQGIRLIFSSIIHKYEKMCLNNKNTSIIAVSEDLKVFLKAAYPRSRVVRIYNAIPFKEISIDTEAVRNKYQVPKETFWIGCVARLAPPKNLGMLIDVANELRRELQDFKISIWGQGPLEVEIQKKIDASNLNQHIKLEGFDIDILSVLKSIDVFVMTSFHEGLPMSLLEAMSVGTPVVCTEVGGIKEIVENNRSGLLVKSEDTEEFKNSVLKIFNDSVMRRTLAENGRKRVEQDFDCKCTNRQLVDLYESLLSN